MPPRLPLRPIAGRAASLTLGKQSTISAREVCLFCSLSTTSNPSRTTRRTAARREVAKQRRHFQSSTHAIHSSAPLEPASSGNPRSELIDTLLELQKHAVNHVNLSRLQLALQGLRQEPGQEHVRVAILALADGAEPGKTARELLRLLLADPLSDEAEWERQLAQHDTKQPLVVRIAQENAAEQGTTLNISKTNLLHELDISSPSLNGHGIELLLMEVNPFSPGSGEPVMQDLEESVLVPTVDIPSNTGRYTPVTTPVHKALVVSEGIMGAASVASLPLTEYRDTVFAAVNLPKYPVEEGEQLTFQPIDVEVGSKGLDRIRENIGNAMEYERSWYKSNVPSVVQWLKAGVKNDENKVTKPVVRLHIASFLRNTLAEIEAEEARLLSGQFSAEVASPKVALMNERLAEWSQFAHEELQQQLDLAFAGKRWRKLGWWKLFWRVDDVGSLTTDMLSQRFLPGAERELVYLAGRIAESGVVPAAVESPSYSQPTSTLQPVVETKTVTSITSQKPKWPTHISFTRRYLHEETVPALQALAQKLVLQASTTSAVTTGLAGLLYVSQYASTIYEAGAVAALGIVWSLRNMQKKWETARTYWEGEVREEGRKAVRGVEQSVANALDAPRDQDTPVEGAEELRRARELVEKAEDALQRLK
ncbi:uncharacterized protein CTRU02_201315 [Colletotrichum truncatum]|uniref:Uncharacterized protein n=1 Tax=Colletotrichum truncatum TaxID=5467 RepID=A0ACC3ZHM1_COLTU|nr:uncharacterized protein CTRU02_08105 [Colletotrichum truncatum]KAF6790585.1 hypothetical protein CTRU02_08105 [Colletotrichum truncatum]